MHNKIIINTKVSFIEGIQLLLSIYRTLPDALIRPSVMSDNFFWLLTTKNELKRYFEILQE